MGRMKELFIEQQEKNELLKEQTNVYYPSYGVDGLQHFTDFTEARNYALGLANADTPNVSITSKFKQ